MKTPAGDCINQYTEMTASYFVEYLYVCVFIVKSSAAAYGNKKNGYINCESLYLNE